MGGSDILTYGGFQSSLTPCRVPGSRFHDRSAGRFQFRFSFGTAAARCNGRFQVTGVGDDSKMIGFRTGSKVPMAMQYLESAENAKAVLKHPVNLL